MVQRKPGLRFWSLFGMIQRNFCFLFLHSLPDRFHDYRLAGADRDLDFSILGNRSQLFDCFAFQVVIAVLVSIASATSPPDS